MAFISSVSIALARNKNHPTNPYFREAWVFSAAIAIVDACTNAASVPLVSPNSISNSSSTKTPPKPPVPPPPLQRFLSVRSQSSNSNLNTEKSTTPQGSQAVGNILPSSSSSASVNRATSTLSLTTTDTNVNSTKVHRMLL
jgi:hypothetical protein